MSWTPERENKLKELWKKGHTASQIASMLGETTRNAVIGKAHRLNLQGRAKSKKPIPKSNVENNSISAGLMIMERSLSLQPQMIIFDLYIKCNCI